MMKVRKLKKQIMYKSCRGCAYFRFTNRLKSDVKDKDLFPYYRRCEYLSVTNKISNDRVHRIFIRFFKTLHIGHPGIRHIV